ncbi:MAG: GDP-mannose 4,6-dehydratase [Acidimicrobiales bacterium]
MATRYLITGGAGFIGSHLAEALLQRGDHVVALDNLSTGRLANLDAVGAHPHFRFVHGSILDSMVVDEAVHECDAVVHLAAAVGVKLIVEQALRSFTTNIQGSETVLEAARRYRRPVLVASSSEVYGKNNAGPLTENMDRVLGPTTVERWSYSTAKAVDEILAFLYHRERGLPTVVARFFNTVGPRQSPAYGMVIPRLVRQALANEPMTVYGDGQQSRTFCHVSDTVRAIEALLDEPAAVGEAFNVGGDREITVMQLAELIRQRTGSGSEIQLIPYDQAFPQGGFEDMRRRVPDTTKLRDLTGWEAARGLDDILDDVIAESAAERVSTKILSH